jgi:hypothetical protein
MVETLIVFIVMITIIKLVEPDENNKVSTINESKHKAKIKKLDKIIEQERSLLDRFKHTYDKKVDRDL